MKSIKEQKNKKQIKFFRFTEIATKNSKRINKFQMYKIKNMCQNLENKYFKKKIVFKNKMNFKKVPNKIGKIAIKIVSKI